MEAMSNWQGLNRLTALAVRNLSEPVWAAIPIRCISVFMYAGLLFFHRQPIDRATSAPLQRETPYAACRSAS